MDALSGLSASDASRRMQAGELTAEGFAKAFLDRIAEREALIGAWAYVDSDLVLRQAREIDRGPWRGKLHGIPVGIKDVIDTAELPTEYNSPIYRGHRPKADAACVALLKRAGAIILGKTATTEFANITPTKTRNPRNTSHTPGGSSSGSAASVADDMVPLALGTQTAGSIIRPAAYCGVFAIKPTFGSVNRAGVKLLSESLDTAGVFGRHPDDLGLTLEVLSGRKYLDLDVAAPRIGLCCTERWLEADRDSRSNIEQIAHRLERSGATVKDFRLPARANELVDRHQYIMGFETARALAWEFNNHLKDISAALAERLSAGWHVPLAEYVATLSLTDACRRQLAETMSDIDFILTLSAPGEAPASLEKTGDSKFNRAWTTLGLPCLNLPFGRGAHGLPLGVQLIGPHESDMRLIAWAKWATRALHEQRSPHAD